MATEIDAARVRESVERWQTWLCENREIRAKGLIHSPSVLIGEPDLEVLANAALDSLTQRDKGRELEGACAELKQSLTESQDLRNHWHTQATNQHVECLGLKAERDQLRSELEAAQQATRHYVEQVAYLSEAANKATEEKRAAQRELDTIRSAPTLQVLSDGIDEAVALERARRDAEVAGLRGEVEAAQVRKRVAEQQNTDLREALEAAQAEFHELVQEHSGAMRELEAARAVNEQTRNAVTANREVMKRMVDHIINERGVWHAEFNAVCANGEALHGRYQTLQRELEAARAERERLQKELADAKEALGWEPQEVPPDVR